MKTIYIIVGPSGSGKTTLVNEYIKPTYGMGELISHTSRPMRLGEVDGVNYHFVKGNYAFDLMERQELFVETAPYNNYMYGTSKNEVEEKLQQHDEICIVMERVGAAAMKQVFNSKECMIVRIFLYASAETCLRHMLADKSRSMSCEHIRHRLAIERLINAVENEEFIPPSMSDYVILSEDNFALNCKQFDDIRKDVIERQTQQL